MKWKEYALLVSEAFLIMIVGVAVHECGHIIVGIICGGTFNGFVFADGLYTAISGESMKWLVGLSGAAFQLTFFIVYMYLRKDDGVRVILFSFIILFLIYGFYEGLVWM